MTNKLEEVFKELQESHVLVDREEYERLVEKVKELEAEEVKFEVGEHYYSREIVFKILKIKMDKKYMDVKYYNPRWSRIELGTSFRAEWDFAKEARKATDEEIKLFKRAEMYHKHGRKLDDLRVDDFVKSGNDIYQITQTKGFVKSIINGKDELYLTQEEAQEAHKKIVGE